MLLKILAAPNPMDPKVQEPDEHYLDPIKKKISDLLEKIRNSHDSENQGLGLDDLIAIVCGTLELIYKGIDPLLKNFDPKQKTRCIKVIQDLVQNARVTRGNQSFDLFHGSMTLQFDQAIAFFLKNGFNPNIAAFAGERRHDYTHPFLTAIKAYIEGVWTELVPRGMEIPTDAPERIAKDLRDEQRTFLLTQSPTSQLKINFLKKALTITKNIQAAKNISAFKQERESRRMRNNFVKKGDTVFVKIFARRPNYNREPDLYLPVNTPLADRNDNARSAQLSFFYRCVEAREMDLLKEMLALGMSKASVYPKWRTMQDQISQYLLGKPCRYSSLNDFVYGMDDTWKNSEKGQQVIALLREAGLIDATDPFLESLRDPYSDNAIDKVIASLALTGVKLPANSKRGPYPGEFAPVRTKLIEKFLSFSQYGDAKAALRSLIKFLRPLFAKSSPALLKQYTLEFIEDVVFDSGFHIDLLYFAAQMENADAVDFLCWIKYRNGRPMVCNPTLETLVETQLHPKNSTKSIKRIARLLLKTNHLDIPHAAIISAVISKDRHELSRLLGRISEKINIETPIMKFAKAASPKEFLMLTRRNNKIAKEANDNRMPNFTLGTSSQTGKKSRSKGKGRRTGKGHRTKKGQAAGKNRPAKPKTQETNTSGSGKARNAARPEAATVTLSPEKIAEWRKFNTAQRAIDAKHEASQTKNADTRTKKRRPSEKARSTQQPQAPRADKNTAPREADPPRSEEKPPSVPVQAPRQADETPEAKFAKLVHDANLYQYVQTQLNHQVRLSNPIEIMMQYVNFVMAKRSLERLRDVLNILELTPNPNYRTLIHSGRINGKSLLYHAAFSHNKFRENEPCQVKLLISLGAKRHWHEGLTQQCRAIERQKVAGYLEEYCPVAETRSFNSALQYY